MPARRNIDRRKFLKQSSLISLGFMALGQLIFVRRTFHIGWRNWVLRSGLLWLLTIAMVMITGAIGLLPLYALTVTSVVVGIAFLSFVIDLRKVISRAEEIR